MAKHTNKIEGTNIRKRKYPFSDSNGECSNLPQPTLFPTYEKTVGTGHLLGSEYQYLMCGFYALKCCTDDRILDFELSTNNIQYNVFDDIIIKVKFKNGPNHTFALQLKHGEPQRKLTIGDFARQNLKNKNFLKNPYCLTKHIDFIKKIQDPDIICILFTNNNTSLTDDLVLDFESDKVKVKICDYFTYTDLLVNTESTTIGDILHLKVSPTNFNQFYLFTNQCNVFTLRVTITQLLRKLVTCDIYDSFDTFLRNWWAGNFVLTKTDIITKLTELSLSPYMITLSGENSNQKSKQLAKSIMNFDITILESQNCVSEIWEEAETLRKLSSTSELVAFTLHANKQLQSICLTALKYGLTNHIVRGNLEDLKFPEAYKIITLLSNNQISKALWYLDKAPLIVKVDDANKNQMETVLQLMNSHFKRKSIVLVGDSQFVQKLTAQVFRSLKDLTTDRNLYNYIVNNFYISLLKKEAIPLKDVLEVDSDSEIFSVGELLVMSQGTLYIGGPQENPPDLYIPRSVSTVFVDTNKLLKERTLWKNSIVIVNCEKRFEYIFASQNTVELSKYLTKQTDSLILSRGCTVDQFDRVCQISNKTVYLFQIFNEKYCTLMLKKGETSEIQGEVQYIEDSAILQHFNNSLHYICADPGMGKSTLMKCLSRNCPPNFWSVLTNVEESDNFDQFLRKILQINDDSFENRFKNFLVKKRKLYLFLDDFDSKSFSFVRQMSREGAHVWMASRDDLKNQIVEAFNVVPLNIKELEEEEQRKYFYESLRSTAESKIFDEVCRKLGRNNRSLLTVPLYLSIITEAFKNGLELELTTILKQLFFGLVNFRFSKNTKVFYERIKLLLFHDYENMALQYCFGDKYAPSCHKVDILALTKQVENKPVFIHPTFAEYFAAVWLRKHSHELPRLTDYFSEKFQNLRFIFDTILSKNNPLHLSIIYRNIQVPQRFDNFKDEGGRTALHLACCYGNYNPQSNYTERVNREDESYRKLVEELLEVKDIAERDDLFKFTCFDYAIKCRCLFPVEKILENSGKSVNFEELFEMFDYKTLAFYAAQLGYYNILNLVLERDSNISKEQFGGYSLLEVAILGSKDENYTVPRCGNIKILERLLPLLDYNLEDLLNLVCKFGCYDTIEVLLKSDKKIVNGNTLLHFAAQYGRINEEILKISEKFGLDLDGKNIYGKTPLVIACEMGYYDIVKLLLEKDTSINDVTCEGRTPLHYAVMSQRREIVELLLEKGVDVAVQDSKGITPLALAQKSGNKDIVQLLVGKEKKLAGFEPKEERFSDLKNTLRYKSKFVDAVEMKPQFYDKLRGFPKETFEKRSGTTDRGRDYEHLVIAKLILHLVTDETVTEFKLSSNDANFGYFDDVVLEVTYPENVTTYAIQLKHTEKSRTLNEKNLTNSKGQFSLKRYFQSFKEIRNVKDNYRFVLYTNYKYDLNEKEPLKLDDMLLKVGKSKSEHFLNNFDPQNSCYKFEVSNGKGPTEQDYQEFFSHFFLCTNQENAVEMEKSLSHSFKRLFACDSFKFNSFMNFLTTWKAREGKIEYLDKNWVQKVIALNVLTQFIRPICFGPVNKKMKLLREAISNFPLTLLEERTSGKIKYLWGDVEEEIKKSDVKEINSLRIKYHLSPNSVDVDDMDGVVISKLLWVQNKCPLIVMANPSVYKAIELCSTEKFILLEDHPKDLERPLFQKLSDLESKSNYSEILTTFSFSLQGKETICLGQMVERDKNFASLVTTSDLVDLLEDYQVGGQKERLSEPYIPRFLSKNVDSEERNCSLHHNYVTEEDFYTPDPSNKINIVCGPPGMGKSELLRSLKNNIKSLTILLTPKEISSMCSHISKNDLKEFLLSIFDDENFGKKIVEKLIDTNQVVYLWDALDELSNQDLEAALNVISELSSKCITQWVTSREFLKTKLEERFRVLSRYLCPLSEEDQHFFIKERLQDSYERVILKLKTLKLPLDDNIFNSPLQMHMLTEALHQEEFFSSEFLSLTDLYRHFVDQKFAKYFKDKINLDLNDVLKQVFESHKKTLLENYQRVALRVIFPREVFNIQNLEDDFDVSQDIGFVRSKDGEIEFVHSSFAEYFAASYLSKNFDRIPNLRILFEQKYTNVRFFLDLLLAQNSNLHIAVLYNNFDSLKRCEDELFKSKDLGGRTVLHIASSWGRRHPLLKIEKIDSHFVVDDDGTKLEESQEYKEILTRLLKKCDLSEVDSVFKMTPLEYAEITRSLFPKIKIFRELDQKFRKIDDCITILYFSSKLGYDDVLDLCENVAVIKNRKGDSLLHLAVAHEDFLKKLLKFSVYKNLVDGRNSDGWTPLHFACYYGYDKSITLLINAGADLSLATGRNTTPLDLALECGHGKCVQLLKGILSE